MEKEKSERWEKRREGEVEGERKEGRGRGRVKSETRLWANERMT